MTANTSSQSGIDREGLWGHAQRSFNWRDKLAEKLAHKSLNIPLGTDDMNVVNSSKTGITWKEIVATGLMLAGLGGLADYLNLFNPDTKPITNTNTVSIPQENRESRIPSSTPKIESSKSKYTLDIEGN